MATMNWRRVLALLPAVLLAQAAWAQSITRTADLSFGAFTAGSGGTVAVAASGLRTRTGGVILVNQGGSASAAQFNVSGTGGAVVILTLPADGTVTLSDGSHTMALNTFVSSPVGLGTLSGGGTLSFSVGATLSVGASQPPGSYSGVFSVTVVYQ